MVETVSFIYLCIYVLEPNENLGFLNLKKGF